MSSMFEIVLGNSLIKSGLLLRIGTCVLRDRTILGFRHSTSSGGILNFSIRICFDFRISNFYSYRSAVTGSKRDAVQAGAKPEIKPVSTDTTMLVTTSPSEN